MPDPVLILIIHAAATWGMAGVIWFIQVVHYPAYRDCGAVEFAAFQARSTARTGFIVGPLMFVELGSAAWLLWRPPGGVTVASLWLGAALIAICWASTLLVQVPLHLRLTARHDPAAITRLLRTNWVRTIAWSLRALLVAMWASGLVIA